VEDDDKEGVRIVRLSVEDGADGLGWDAGGVWRRKSGNEGVYEESSIWREAAKRLAMSIKRVIYFVPSTPYAVSSRLS